MPLVIGIHEVADVKSWLASPLRKQVFDSKGIKVTTFADPAGSNLTGLLFDVPDMGEFQKLMESDEVQQSAAQDGVRMETLRVLVAA
jgi:hypothetical protein